MLTGSSRPVLSECAQACKLTLCLACVLQWRYQVWCMPWWQCVFRQLGLCVRAVPKQCVHRCARRMPCQPSLRDTRTTRRCHGRLNPRTVGPMDRPRPRAQCSSDGLRNGLPGPPRCVAGASAHAERLHAKPCARRRKCCGRLASCPGCRSQRLHK